MRASLTQDLLAARKAKLQCDAELQRTDICHCAATFAPVVRNLDLGIKLSRYAKSFWGVVQMFR